VPDVEEPESAKEDSEGEEEDEEEEEEEESADARRLRFAQSNFDISPDAPRAADELTPNQLKALSEKSTQALLQKISVDPESFDIKNAEHKKLLLTWAETQHDDDIEHALAMLSMPRTAEAFIPRKTPREASAWMVRTMNEYKKGLEAAKARVGREANDTDASFKEKQRRYVERSRTSLHCRRSANQTTQGREPLSGQRPTLQAS
jgi:hypothetical protein